MEDPVTIKLEGLRSGQKLRLVGDIIAEVVENPGDGIGLRARFLIVPNEPSLEGIEDQIFSRDIVGLV